MSSVGLVMTGGGARAAYQVGVLSGLTRRFPQLRATVLTGASAGAINAAYIAAHTGTLAERVEGLRRVWCGIDIDRVFESELPSLMGNVTRWGARLIGGGTSITSGTRGLVDNSPLLRLLERELGASRDQPIPGIAENLASGELEAVAIATTSYHNGRTINWLQSREPNAWERPRRRGVPAVLTPAHVLASSAIPLFFPAVALGTTWHGDGDMRMNAPLAPAVHLGAERILAISTRFRDSAPPPEPESRAAYPPPAHIIGMLMNSMFLDFLDQDALLLERINRLVRVLPDAEREGFRPVRLAMIRPSVDLGKLANRFESRLPGSFRFLTRGLGTREVEANDMLSIIMFQNDYLDALLRQGEADAELHVGEVEALLEN